MKKTYPFLIILFSLIKMNSINAQCTGTWSVGVSTMNYLCANGPFMQYSVTANSCPTNFQGIFYFTVPQQTVELKFSAFGSVSGPGSSRMAVFINGNKIDLAKACNITLGCQSVPGTYSINSGCLVDATPGTDGGISGSIFLTASSYSLSSITNIGIGITEPGSSGTIFQIGACNPICSGTGINEHSLFPESHFVYPNPASNRAYFVIPDSSSEYILDIFDTKGTLLESKSLKGGEKTFFIGESGLYFYSLKDSGNITYRGKFLLQN